MQELRPVGRITAEGEPVMKPSLIAWIRLCLLALCLSAAVFAGTPMAVDDLVGMVNSEFAVDRDDQRIAHALDSVRLAERLTDSTVDMLRQMGAGRATVRQLETLARKSRSLPLPAEEPISTTPRLSASERAAIVDAMRRYASGYAASLPDFLCTRDARQFRTKVVRRESVANTDGSADSGAFQDGAAKADGSVHDGSLQSVQTEDRWWRSAGSYTAEVSFAGRADRYKLTLVNNKPTTESFDQIQKTLFWGEFAGALKEVFDSHPDFEWDRWEVTGGVRSAVFTYHVDQAHSGYLLCCPRFTTAHRGFIYADPRSGAVRRIIIYAIGLTENSQVNAAGHVLDYREVKIGDGRYLLPKSSVAYSRAGLIELREDIDYRSYRKFGAEATLEFPSADESPR